MTKNYTDRRRKENNGGDNDIIGIVLIIISSFLLLCLCIPVALGSIGSAIRTVAVGVAGLAAYPIFLSTLLLGIALLRGRRVTLAPRYVVALAVAATCLLLILQLATSHGYLSQSFPRYVSSVYGRLTAGGVLFGIVVYGIQAAITPVLSYVAYSAGLVVATVFLLFPLLGIDARAFFSRRSVERKKTPLPSAPFEKGLNSPRTVKPLADTTLFVDKIIPKQHNSFLSEDSSFSEIGKKTMISSFTSEEVGDTSAGVESHWKTGREKTSGFKTQAHQILFGDTKIQLPPLPPKVGAEARREPYASDSEYASSPAEQSAPDREYASSPVPPPPARKPPKIVHIDDIPELKKIPVPPPKDFSSQIVDGPIINGDEVSGRMAEENSARIHASDAVKREQPKFFTKKIEPTAARPRSNDRWESYNGNTETAETEPPQAPITNGDYFGRPLQKNGVSEKSRLDENQEQSAAEASVAIPAVERWSEDPEIRFQKLFDEEKSTVGRELSEPDAGERDGSLSKNVQAEERTSEVRGAFRYIDEAEDLSEQSHWDGEDHTGYYEQTESKPIESKPPEKKTESASFPLDLRALTAGKVAGQIKIDDYISSAPVETKPKKKRNVRYDVPPIDLLLSTEAPAPEDFNTACEEKARLLEETLKGLKLPATVNAITRGPAVTRYELEMPPGIPIKRIEQYATDIEYYLACNGKIRIETPIPGKRAVGIEVPNEKVDVVGLRDIIASKEFQSSSSPVTVALGKDIAGSNIVCNLEKMPHLLIAGATGSGKSACLNSIIISMLYKSSPEDVRIILIDPKHVEFTIYKGLPHLLTPEIITDAQQAINALKWARAEMERRYILFGKYIVRNLQEFNKSDAVKEGTESKLPYIVLIVDELAELMMSNNRKELEDKIMSMAQKARAAGIHLILATQRPSVDVITGTIKANLPSRIAFSVKSLVDSRTILDHTGAETLLGRGDMLYAPLGFDDPRRVQGAYVTNEEVATVVSYVRDHNEADFDGEIEDAISVKEEAAEDETEGEEEREFDEIMPEALKCVIEAGMASISMIQRRFSVGYARAARIIDQMEGHKFIGPSEGSKPRSVYITAEQYNELFGKTYE